MRIKKGVILEGVQPPTFYAMGVCDMIFESLKRTFTVTSGVEGKHPDKRNIHGNGWAFDIRIRDLTKEQANSFYLRIKSFLDPQGFDTVLEGDHVHVEYDPKMGENWLTEVE